LRAQYHSLKTEIDTAVLATLESTQYILGEQVRAFEQEVAAFCGVRYAIGVNSGTDALLLALKSCGVEPGDEVITVSNSFFATAAAIRLCGATPVFVDVGEGYLIDPSLIEAAVSRRTKAIIPVHLYGQLADMDAINEMARRHHLFVIEDACQAIGARRNGTRAGNFGDVGCFSFVPAKNLGGFGDGGMVVTNNSELAERARLYRDHGSSRKYYHDVVGYNSRLDSLQAAMLRVKLTKLDAWNETRRQRARLYTQLLRELDVITPTVAGDDSHIYHLYVIRTTRREALMQFLRDCEIATLIHYPVPIHQQRAFADCVFPPLPNTERFAPQILSLPMFPEMTEAQVHEVVGAIGEFSSA
jgi:dTDP-4-amino-4,6-dideoxygalactose transaminase